jgi:hypothetical protein
MTGVGGEWISGWMWQVRRGRWLCNESLSRCLCAKSTVCCVQCHVLRFDMISSEAIEFCSYPARLVGHDAVLSY